MATLAGKSKFLRSVAVDILSDFLTVSLGWMVFNIIRYYSLPITSTYASSFEIWLNTPPVLFGQVVVPLCMLLLYAFSGSYNFNPWQIRSRLDQALNTWAVSFVGVIGIFFAVLFDDNIPERLTNFELMAVLLLCLAIPTSIIRAIVTTRRTKKLIKLGNLRPALIIGVSNNDIPEIKRIIRSATLTGYRIVGVIASENCSEKTIGGIDVLHGTLPTLIREHRIQAVMLPLSSHSIIDSLYKYELPIYILPGLNEMASLRPRVHSVRPEPMVYVNEVNMTPVTANMKRLGDIIFSVIALICLLPIYAIVAIAIKCDSHGPIFYRQVRLGRYRKPFHIIKFRTMHTDAEVNGPSLTTSNDKRVTRLGHWLRKYRIDELPQFWNVLVGQMSIVGPRPERQIYAEQIIARKPAYTMLYQVRPGITSWGMVKYGYASNVDQMVERMSYDLLYLQNISLPIDLKILLHTVSTIITGRGV